MFKTMRPDSRKALQTGTIPTAESFRASTTGIGQSLSASAQTGAIRAQRVADSCPPRCANQLPPSYPRPMSGMYGSALSGMTPTGNPAAENPAKVMTTHPKRRDKTLPTL